MSRMTNYLSSCRSPGHPSFHAQYLISFIPIFLIIPWIIQIAGNTSSTLGDGVSSCNRSRIHITNSTWGIISDGPTNYTQNSHCEWLIEAPEPSDLITLMIHSLRTECSYDYLFIFDGKSYSGSSLLASLSGATKPLVPFVAKSGYMLLLMYSDTNYALEGFVGEYFVSSCPLHCTNWTSDCSGDSKCICESLGDTRETCQSQSRTNLNTTNTFSSTPLLSLQRIGHSAIRLENYIYVYGGFDLNVILNDLIIMDLDTESIYPLQTENEVREDTDTNSVTIWPSGRYGHASVQFKSGFFVQGGRTSGTGGGISNELLYFDAVKKKWRKFAQAHEPLPHLIYHTMVMTTDHVVYVYGGGNPAGIFSSTLYKFHAESPEKWEIVQTFCCGKSKDRSLLAHTMNYWGERNALLVFGGLVSDLGRFSKLSSQLWMYLIDEQVWLSLDYRKPGPGSPTPSTGSKILERGFHSTQSIGNHLVMIGGYTHAHNRDEVCYAQHILLYNLDCHVLVSEDPLGGSMEGEGVFGHRSIFWKREEEQEILVIGGYRGYLNPKVGRIPLSLSGSGCGTYNKRWRCSGDPLCGWCPTDDKCYEKISGSKNCTTNLQTSQCPGICPTLKTCQACVLPRGCSWCESLEVCMKAEDDHSTGLCPGKNLRTTLTSCSNKVNDRQEITLAEYRHPVVLSQPDSLRFLNATAFIIPRDVVGRGDDGSGGSMYIMKGILDTATSPMNRMELCALQSHVHLTMFMPHPSETLSLYLRWSDVQSCLNLSWSSGLPVSLMPGIKIMFELIVNSSSSASGTAGTTALGLGPPPLTTSVQKIPPEKFGHVSLRHNSKIFRKENLHVYSSNGEECGAAASCLLCLTDGSCAWEAEGAHPLGGRCRKRAETSKGNATFVITPAECAMCQDFTTCSECLRRRDCEWSDEEAGCSRKGRTPPALLLNVEDPASCSPDCHLRSNCSTCLDIPGACVWCSHTQECFPFSVYTSFYQYGQCFSWKDRGSQCQECVKQSNCEDCVLHLGCGWNYNDSGGSCMEGDFKGPTPNEDDNNTSIDLHAHSHEWTWTYDKCPDVDECNLGIHECHENASCVNTPGAYVCLCSQGFTGDGKSSCARTCYEPCIHGTCTTDFLCECELGWTGIDCSIDCGCNNHSTCETPSTGCDKCQDLTEGTHCERCVSGSFGNATLVNVGCRECECNWNGDPKQGYCDSVDGKCFCLKHTTGMHCSKCEPGYFGNPELGESCYRDCHGRAVLESSLGFFGVDPSKGNANPQHCLWIINVKLAMAEDQGSKVKREILTESSGDKSNGIRIIISSNFQIPCSENALRIYSGLPSFSRATKNAQLLASICSYEGERPGQTEVIVDVHGVFATIVLEYAHGSLQKALFNASYQRSTLRAESSSTSTISTPDALDIEKLSDGQSVLPRFGHTLHADERSVWIFGGYSFSHGFLNDIRQFRRDLNQWIPLTITIVQNEDSVPLARYFHAAVLGPNSEIFIHGGIASNLSFLSDTWRFDTRLSRWKRLSNERKALQLAGHSLTIRGNPTTAPDDHQHHNFCQLVLIGGINPIGGFSNKVFYFNCDASAAWEETNTTGSSPVGIYGHSTVYHRASDTFYIFGGVVYERDKVLVSPNLYALHWPSRRWTLLPPNPENQVLPLPSARFFHSAVTTDSYMVVLGGAGSPKNFSLLAYVYQCNLWLLGGNWPEVHRSAAGTSYVKSELLVMGGWDGISSKESLVRIKFPQDVCSLQTPEEKCKETLGCSYCSANNNQSQQCYNSSVDMPKECSTGASNIVFWKGTLCSHQWMEGRNCSHYTTCSDCLASWPAHPNLKQACQWCTNCQVGKCIPVSKKCQGEAACGLKQRETIDSSHCPERLCSASECEKCTASGKCIWTRQILKSSEWSFQLHSQPLYDWNCVRKSILDTSPSFTVSSSPPEKCPAPCVEYQTCEDCLNAPGSDGGFQECHWSLSLNRCVSPAHKNLVCFGGVCGSVLRGQPTICPKPCSAHTSCSSCLEFPYCGWCATEGRNGEGRCLPGDYFFPAEDSSPATPSSVAVNSNNSCLVPNWNYLTCPAEDECVNNHHTCNEASENCIDLNIGFKCVCRDGYEKSKDSCVPICHQGCVHGTCVTPDKCSCHFGFVGTNCSSQCNCNGHSHCASEAELDICLDCKNNTMGTQCSRCKHFFVGDPKNGGTCIPCAEYCNGHSDVCLSWEAYEKTYNGSSTDTSMESQIKASAVTSTSGEESEPGPLNRAFCVSCKHETSGEKCDDCIPGYFRGTEDKRLPCRKCECHGHGDKCDSVTGLDCNCSNNTESDHCTQGSKQSGQQCWKLQCAKCREYYLGIPTNGHHCYRQMHVDTDYCFDPKSQESCTVSPKPLLSGRTVFFAVQPKFMNVNIRINLDVTHGAVHAYLSPKEDTFVIRQDSNTWMHLVEFDTKYNIGGNMEQRLAEEQEYSDGNLTESSVISKKAVLNDYFELKELEAAGFATHVKVEEPRSVLLVRNLRNRLVITLPQEDHDLRLTRFYIVLEGIGDVSFGSIFFRQDQLHIDLFVFFSVFFSAFFLFLAACGIAWKFKQNLETRRARHRHAEQMLSMAKRPFATWTLILEPDSSSPLYRVYNQCRKSCRKGCICLRPVAVEPTHDGSSAVCTMFVSLPGAPTAPVRLALASGLSNIPAHHSHARRRRL